MSLIWSKIIVTKSSEVKPGRANLIDNFAEAYGSKGGCFASNDDNVDDDDKLVITTF
jgi:hypothetical protein